VSDHELILLIVSGLGGAELAHLMLNWSNLNALDKRIRAIERDLGIGIESSIRRVPNVHKMVWRRRLVGRLERLRRWLRKKTRR